MPDALERLWHLLEGPQEPVTAEDVDDELMRLGFFREVESATSIICPECHTHREEVIVRPGPRGTSRYFIACPSRLRVEIPPASLRQWLLDATVVAGALATLLQLGGQCAELIPNRVWRLGRWTARGATRDCLLVRGLARPDAAEYRRAITAAKRPIAFIPGALPKPEFWLGHPPPLIRLPAVTTLMEGRLVLDAMQVINLVHDADRPPDDSRAVLNVILDRKIRGALAAQLTEEQIVQAYVANGSSARKAAKDLVGRGFTIHHSKVLRVINKYQDVLRAGSSDSVVRTRSSQRSDTPPRKPD